MYFKNSVKDSRILITFSLFLIVWIFSGTLLAEDSIDQIIDRYLEAVGGKEDYQKIRSQVMKGEFSMPDMGIYASMELYVQSPDKVLMRIDLAEYGEVMNGVNGDIAWEINPMMGPRVLQGGEKQAALRRAAINEFLNWRKYFKSAEITGEEMVQDEACVKTIFTPLEGEPVEYFFSKESGLIRRVISNLGAQFVEMNLSDYQEVGDIKVPFFMEMISPQFSFEMQMESVENNVDIPVEKFKIPEEIQALAGN